MSKNQTRFYEKLIRSYRFQKEATFGSYRNRKGLPQGFVFKQRNLCLLLELTRGSLAVHSLHH